MPLDLLKLEQHSREEEEEQLVSDRTIKKEKLGYSIQFRYSNQ